MTTKKWNILSIITKTGVLDEDVLKNDLQLVTAYYIDQGYLDVKVSEPKIDLHDPKRIRIEIEIVEGPQYRLANIDFKGDVLTTKEDLFRVIKIKRNDVYRTSVIRREIGTLTEKFADQGYANVEITPEPSVDSKNLLVNLTLTIEKKKRVSFEKIQFVGNAKTRDKVVRRELRVAEGELYSATALNKSRLRLKRLGFFKEVDFTTSPGSTYEKVNLDIKLEEAPTGALSFGLGYSTIEKVVGTTSISDRNLLGMGYYGMVRFSLGLVSRDLRLSFTDPYFLGSRFAVGPDFYDYHMDWSTYSYDIVGADFRVGRELTDTLRALMMYKLERIHVYNLASDASYYIQAQAGEKTTSALAFTLSMDNRNDYFVPTSGARHSLMIENAGGILGGDNYFVKVLGQTSWYFPMPLNTVLNLRGQLGYIQPYGGTIAPIYEKFFVGGINTVRGFEYGWAGPKDINNEPLGALKMAVFNSELIFPIAREIGLRGAVFWDIGKGSDTWSGLFPLRTAAGIGIRWYSPFGPIHIDLGFNLNRQPGEKSQVLDFKAGTAF